MLKKTSLNIKVSILVVNLLIFTTFLFAGSDVCNSCGFSISSQLSMYCGNCNELLHSTSQKSSYSERSNLQIIVYYTGQRLNRIPESGKVFINGRLKGEIDLQQTNVESNKFNPPLKDIDGQEVNAWYKTEIVDVQSGIKKVEVEMKFNRFYGLARSFKRVSFPYVLLKPGQTSKIEHRFNQPATFSEHEPQKPEKLPVFDDVTIRVSSGTLRIEAPVF